MKLQEEYDWLDKDLACNLVPLEHMLKYDISPLSKTRRKRVRRAMAHDELNHRLDVVRRRLGRASRLLRELNT